MDSAYEHIALVTFGSETCVQKHLTCDYVEIIRKLDRLRPGGPSPMYAGLQMVHAAVIGAGMIFKSNGKRICPRVFLITDGKATPAGMIAGPDHCPAEQIFKEQLPILDVVKTIHEKFHANFYPVPVGDFNLSILENIVKISNGKIVSPEDWRMQSRVFKNYLAAAKLCGGISKFMAPGLSTMMLDALNASSDDKAQMEEFIHTHQQDDDDDDDSETYEEDNFPPLGSRVCLQLSGSTIMTESKQDLGTVTKHFQDGYIGVTWDHPRSDDKKREKIFYQDSMRAISLVDEPRILNKEMIAEGCRVMRGKDWSYQNQDGGAGNLGSVFCVKPNGIVNVRWDNGNKNTYKFGAEGKFDIEIVGQRANVQRKPTATFNQKPLTDIESDETGIKKMNDKNRYIFNCEGIETSATEGAAVMLPSNQPTAADGKSRTNKKKIQMQDLKHENNISGKDNNNVEDLNRRNVANACRTTEEIQQTKSDLPDVHFTEAGHTHLGAKPKTSAGKQSAQLTKKKIQWLWKDNDTWKEYPQDISEKIETSFKQNPRGTTVVRLNDLSFRVVFPRMEQVNVDTKEKYSVVRNT